MTTRLRPGWRKSSYSSNGGASCVEVKFAGASVFIRDSKYLRDPANDPATQPIIELRAADWPHFLTLAAGRTTAPVAGLRSLTRHADDSITITATDGTSLTYTPDEWTAFLAGIRAGEFAAA
ncbi:DUF397 domain-containing protein [Nocardia terpenica]|uniref:DUF397 domain-containing protein n=1 Tax=Nocardia terpenica TaxID=455432 RepID=A0A6G9Z061_9NOCA|nr:DUF397 domain-containing protein [Nocardia terpenica]QIS18751.1 DUF397 domain-containing protein [Nocardia terpenica]